MPTQGIRLRDYIQVVVCACSQCAYGQFSIEIDLMIAVYMTCILGHAGCRFLTVSMCPQHGDMPCDVMQILLCAMTHEIALQLAI